MKRKIVKVAIKMDTPIRVITRADAGRRAVAFGGRRRATKRVLASGEWISISSIEQRERGVHSKSCAVPG